MMMETSPRRDTDGDGDGSTRGRRQPVVVPRSVMPGAVGDVGPLGRACHDYGSCRGVPIPIRC
jgi:hypothetical protein